MLLSALAITSITNFILASEAFFLAGLFVARAKARFSAAWFWQWALLGLASTALLGGIDHGFFEVFGQIPVRKVIEHTNWFLIGLLTLAVFLTTVQQFVRPAWRKYLYALAGLQLAVYTAAILLMDNFLIVMANYAPVMLWLLVCSVRGVKSGTGTWAMVLGIVIAFAASGIQAAQVDVFSPFDRNSLYHFGMMLALVFLYRGGLRLSA